jgi:hypothetical protein
MWNFLKKAFGSEPGAAAESEDATTVRRSAALSATMHGSAMSADGRAEISEESEWQRFFVEVTADVADGTVLTLIVDGRPVAPIVISNSEGEFEFASSDGVPIRDELQDLGRIKTLGVATREGVLVLTGSFDSSQ